MNQPRTPTPLEESEINANRKDREDGIPMGVRYGVTRTGKVAHILVGHVGLAAECSATAHRDLPAREVIVVCGKCESRRPVSPYTVLINATPDMAPRAYPDVTPVFAGAEPPLEGRGKVLVVTSPGSSKGPTSTVDGPFEVVSGGLDDTLKRRRWGRIGPWQTADGITYARAQRA